MPASSRFPSLWTLCCILLLSLLVVWLPALGRKAPPEPAADAVGYLNIAYHLAHHQVFADPGTPPTETPPSGSMVAPLYPALLAGMMRTDAVFDRHVACFLHRFYASTDQAALAVACDGVSPEATVTPKGWGHSLTILRLFMALGLALVWLTARRLGLSRPAAGVAFVLAAASGAYGEYGQQYLTEGLTLPLGTLVSLLLVEGCRTLRTPSSGKSILLWWLVAGGAFGVAALTRPTFGYVLYLAVLALGGAALWRLFRRQPLVPLLLAGVALVIGYGVVIAPWLWRNHQLFGLTAITGPYGGYILAQRVAYNAMSVREWLASLLFWLPDFGDSLARLFFPADLLARLDWYSPDAYYVLGNGAWMREMLAQAGSKDALQGWVLREKVFADLPAHLAVTISLALRGLWVSKYFGLIGAAFWLPSLVRAVRRQQGLWLAFCAPALVLLGLQAFVSVSIPRYNLLVIPCMAIAAAPLLLVWGQCLSRTVCRLFNKKG